MTFILDTIYAHIDSQESVYINKLAEAVAIPSVSGDPLYRSHVFKMGEWLTQQLQDLGVE